MLVGTAVEATATTVVDSATELTTTVLDAAAEELAATIDEELLAVEVEMWKGKEYWKVVGSESSEILKP